MAGARFSFKRKPSQKYTIKMRKQRTRMQKMGMFKDGKVPEYVWGSSFYGNIVRLSVVV